MKLKEIENARVILTISCQCGLPVGGGVTKKNRKMGKHRFLRRVVVLTGALPVPAAGTCGAAGAPGGIQGVPASEAGGGTVPPAAQYDLIADLLDANKVKVYADMLKSDKHTIVGIQVR